MVSLWCRYSNHLEIWYTRRCLISASAGEGAHYIYPGLIHAMDLWCIGFPCLSFLISCMYLSCHYYYFIVIRRWLVPRLPLSFISSTVITTTTLHVHHQYRSISVVVWVCERAVCMCGCTWVKVAAVTCMHITECVSVLYMYVKVFCRSRCV